VVNRAEQSEYGGRFMDFLEKAKIRLEHWITHNDHHQEEYEIFAEQLEAAKKNKSAQYIREMIELNSKSNECLRKALRTL
jgi:predicted patatin/cPLA2 family phospholipase